MSAPSQIRPLIADALKHMSSEAMRCIFSSRSSPQNLPIFYSMPRHRIFPRPKQRMCHYCLSCSFYSPPHARAPVPSLDQTLSSCGGGGHRHARCMPSHQIYSPHDGCRCLHTAVMCTFKSHINICSTHSNKVNTHHCWHTFQ